MWKSVKLCLCIHRLPGFNPLVTDWPRYSSWHFRRRHIHCELLHPTFRPLVGYVTYRLRCGSHERCRCVCIYDPIQFNVWQQFTQIHIFLKLSQTHTLPKSDLRESFKCNFFPWLMPHTSQTRVATKKWHKRQSLYCKELADATIL